MISKATNINEAPDDFLNTRNGKTNAIFHLMVSEINVRVKDKKK